VVDELNSSIGHEGFIQLQLFSNSDMSLFKKIFGSRNNQLSDSEVMKDNVPVMTEQRKEAMAICLEAGFLPVDQLPTELNRQLRPSLEIAQRLHALMALILWVVVPEENLTSERILSFIDQNVLDIFITKDEKKFLKTTRDDEQARNEIGWKFENIWPLAWYFGYEEPGILGDMMTGDRIQNILMNHTCPLNQNIQEWIQSKKIISEKNLIYKEDLFYCLHNAVRSAQLGGHTVPEDFDPMVNGGVIHERRHSLTWMLSKGVGWDETDLST